MKIVFEIEGTSVTGTLAEGEPARDFASLLPLVLTLTDYAPSEKVSDLPRRLSTAGAPKGTAAVVGDITYYAPWGNLAIFYRPFRHADGLVKLGHLEGAADLLSRPGPLKVTISLA